MTELELQIVSYIPRLRCYAKALLRGQNLLVDDLVQDCLERALERSHLFNEGTDLRAWLFTIMHNVNANQVKRVSHGPEFVEFSQTYDIAFEEKLTSSIELRELDKAVSKLPLMQRQILLLVTLEGCSYQQVAEILDIPVGTVMSKLSRARQQLRKITQRQNTAYLRSVK